MSEYDMDLAAFNLMASREGEVSSCVFKMKASPDLCNEMTMASMSALQVVATVRYPRIRAPKNGLPSTLLMISSGIKSSTMRDEQTLLREWRDEGRTGRLYCVLHPFRTV
jgi:hypothetical protein